MVEKKKKIGFWTGLSKPISFVILVIFVGFVFPITLGLIESVDGSNPPDPYAHYKHEITSEDSITVSVLINAAVEKYDVIWIGFYTENGGKYRAVHVLKAEGNNSVPYILLSSPDHNRKEFREVAGLINYLTGDIGKEEEITDREDDICQVILLPKNISKEQINNLFKQYAEYFYSLRMEKRFTADN